MAKEDTKEKGKDAKDAKDAKNGEAPAEQAAEPKKSRAKLFIILGAVVVLLGGGGAGAYFVLRTPAAAKTEKGGDKDKATAKPKHKKPEDSGIVNFEPFVVNLADPGRKRFLRINVRLIVDGAEKAEHIQKSEVLLMRLRSDILEQLTEQTSERIATAEGKTALKASIAERAKHIVEPTEIADVLFSDFVVQY